MCLSYYGLERYFKRHWLSVSVKRLLQMIGEDQNYKMQKREILKGLKYFWFVAGERAQWRISGQNFLGETHKFIQKMNNSSNYGCNLTMPKQLPSKQGQLLPSVVASSFIIAEDESCRMSHLECFMLKNFKLTSLMHSI